MKKKLGIILAGIVVLAVAGLIVAGNYFYNQGVKRGTDIELHREASSVNAKVSGQGESLLKKDKDWYKKQEKEIVDMKSYDGLQLKAKWIQNDADTHKAVILAHGFRNTGDNMGKYAKMYNDMGFDILLPDARGHGDSAGDYIGYGWHDRLDYMDWIQLIIDKYDEEQIILDGNSMGAATVLMTSGEQLPSEVKGIVADSAYSSVKAELKHQLKHIYHLPSFPLLDVTSGITKIRAGYTFGGASTIDQVKKNTRPLLIIHGDADELVPTDMAYEIYDAAGGDKEQWIVPDVGHTKAFDKVTKEYKKRIKAFVDHALDQS